MVDWFRGEASKDHAESLAQLVDKVGRSPSRRTARVRTLCWVGQAGMTELSLDLHRHDSQAATVKVEELRLAGDFDSDIFEVSQSFDGDTM